MANEELTSNLKLINFLDEGEYFKKYVDHYLWPIPLLSLVIETFINPLKQGRHCARFCRCPAE